MLHPISLHRGATTDAGVWLVGSIGVACGLGFYLHAVAATAIAIIVLAGIGAFERIIGRRCRKHQANLAQAPVLCTS
ncbi:MAG: MgtC/SapB family protein [Alphaproteobacteria bacterium]